MVRKIITTSVIDMPESAFVLAVKKDTDFVVKSLGGNAEQQKHLTEAYDRFCEGLNSAFESFYDDAFELHIFDDVYVETQQKLKAVPYVAVSLDPCVKEPDAFALGVSRHFRTGGLELIGLDARPGFPALEQQITNLKDYAGDKPVALIEDDIFSGFTMLQTVERLQNNGINVKAIVPGIQIGSLTALADSGLIIDPVHRYNGTPEQMKNIDLADYRDFLLGVDGLVIDNGKDGKSRVPFLTPFTSPNARIGVPLANEARFAEAVWALNATFFDETNLSANDMNPYAIAALNPKLLDNSTSMREAVRQISGI